MLSFLLRFLTILISCELILGPTIPSLKIVSNASAVTCETGMTFSQQLNRCVISAEVNTQRQLRDDCMALTEDTGITDDTERSSDLGMRRTNCLNSGIDQTDLANVKDPKAKVSGNAWVGTTMGMATFATVAAIIGIFKYKLGNPQCKATSLLLLGAGAAASMVGEVMSIVKFNKKIGEAKDTYEKLKKDAGTAASNDPDEVTTAATNIQVGAFDAMIAKENATKEAANIKKTVYIASIAAYGLAGALAAYEHFKMKSARETLTKSITKLNTSMKGASTAIVQQNLTCQTQKPTLITQGELAGQKTLVTVKTTEINDITSTTNVAASLSKIQTIANSKSRKVTGDPDFDLNMSVIDGAATAVQTACTPVANTLNSDFIAFKASIANLKKAEMVVCETKNQRGSIEDSKPKNFIDYFENIKAYAEVKQYVNDYIDSLEDVTLAEVSRAMISPILGFAYATEDLKAEDYNKIGEGKNNFMTYVGPIIGAAGALAVSFGKASDFLMGAPMGRMTFSFAMAGFGGVVLGNAIKNAKVAEERIEILEELKGKVVSVNGMFTCTVADRDDQSKPNCYCYSSDGTKNAARTNSQTCMNEWGKPMKFNFNKNSLAGTKGPVGCLNNKNKFDEKCSCRSQKDPKTGKNTCQKMSMNMKFPIPQINAAGSQVGGALNDIYSGNFDSANFGGLGNTYGAMRKVKDAILKKIGDPNLIKAANASEKGMIDSINSNSNLNQSMPPFNSAPAPLPTSGSAKEQVAAMEKELKKASDDSVKMAAVPAGALPGLGADDGFNLEMGDENAGGVVEESSGIMAQNFDYGDNDITLNPGANIFEVLSVRYKRSAMRRLFDTEGKLQADEANESDIQP